MYPADVSGNAVLSLIARRDPLTRGADGQLAQTATSSVTVTTTEAGARAQPGEAVSVVTAYLSNTSLPDAARVCRVSA